MKKETNELKRHLEDEKAETIDFLYQIYLTGLMQGINTSNYFEQNIDARERKDALESLKANINLLYVDFVNELEIEYSKKYPEHKKLSKKVDEYYKELKKRL